MSRLDEELSRRELTSSRSQGENLIKLGHVKLNGRVVKKPSTKVQIGDKIEIEENVKFVSRAALKLKSAAEFFEIDFKAKSMLDVGISTGGFTQYALSQGLEKAVGVELGTNQLHATLRNDPRIELHEKTDIRSYEKPSGTKFDFIVIDVSFISMREVLPHVLTLANPATQIIAMLKPQFEAGDGRKHKGVIKNDSMRRKILKDFEAWLQDKAYIVDKKDSDVSGKKGNVERFYLLKTLSN